MPLLRATVLTFVAVLCLSLTWSACAKAPASRPGSINVFDSNAYDSLITVQAALESASSQVAQFPQIKPELNRLIGMYNTTMEAYRAYHLSGGSTDAAPLVRQVASLTTAVAALIRQIHPAPSPGPAAPTSTLRQLESV